MNEYENICTCTLWSMSDIMHMEYRIFIIVSYKSSSSDPFVPTSEIFICDV